MRVSSARGRPRRRTAGRSAALFKSVEVMGRALAVGSILIVIGEALKLGRMIAFEPLHFGGANSFSHMGIGTSPMPPASLILGAAFASIGQAHRHEQRIHREERTLPAMQPRSPTGLRL